MKIDEDFLSAIQLIFTTDSGAPFFKSILHDSGDTFRPVNQYLQSSTRQFATVQERASGVEGMSASLATHAAHPDIQRSARLCPRCLTACCVPPRLAPPIACSSPCRRPDVLEAAIRSCWDHGCWICNRENPRLLDLQPRSRLRRHRMQAERPEPGPMQEYGAWAASPCTAARISAWALAAAPIPSFARSARCATTRRSSLPPRRRSPPPRPAP